MLDALQPQKWRWVGESTEEAEEMMATGIKRFGTGAAEGLKKPAELYSCGSVAAAYCLRGSAGIRIGWGMGDGGWSVCYFTCPMSVLLA